MRLPHDSARARGRAHIPAGDRTTRRKRDRMVTTSMGSLGKLGVNTPSAKARPVDVVSTRVHAVRAAWLLAAAVVGVCVAGFWNVRAVDGLGVAIFVSPVVGAFEGLADQFATRGPAFGVLFAAAAGLAATVTASNVASFALLPFLIFAVCGVWRGSLLRYARHDGGDGCPCRCDLRRLHRTPRSGRRGGVQCLVHSWGAVVRGLRRDWRGDARRRCLRVWTPSRAHQPFLVDHTCVPGAARRQGDGGRSCDRELHSGAPAGRLPRGAALRGATVESVGTARSSWPPRLSRTSPCRLLWSPRW